MAIAYNNSASNGTNGTSVSATLTVGTLTNGIMLIFCADQNGSDTITTPTVGGSSSGVTLVDAYTQDPSTGGVNFIKVYKKLAPASGSTTVTFTHASGDMAIGVITFDGVDQTTPTRTAAHARSASTSVPTVNATTVAGDVVAEFFAWSSVSANVSFTNDASQTQRQNRNAGNQGLAIAQETASGTSTTASGTLSSTIAWGVIAVPLIAASGGGGGLAHLLSGKLSNLLAGKLG